MPTDPLDRTIFAALGVTGLALFAAGAGWALTGDAIFLSQMMAGLAGCF